MSKLRLGPIADDKPVKLAIELPGALHRELVAYAEVHAKATGPRQADVAREDSRSDDRAFYSDRPRLRDRASPALKHGITPAGPNGLEPTTDSCDCIALYARSENW